MTTDFRQTITDPVVCEKTTALFTFTFTDETDSDITAGVSAVTLTLYVKSSGTILNSRNAQSVFNINGGTISGATLSLLLSNLDNVLESQLAASEKHVALIEYSWANNTKFGKKEVTFTVINQKKVT